jgi:oligopeptide/dipeptide ABC transporter ATP-binding protein
VNESQCNVLELQGVTVRYGQGHRAFTAVDSVDLVVPRRRTLGLVGESGCGKSTLARAIVGLVPMSSGKLLLDGSEVASGHGGRGKSFRRRVQLVFQDPNASLNPRMAIGDMLNEALSMRANQMSAIERRAEALRTLDLVGIGPKALERYPHQFSGGQKQRLAIARALAVSPELLVLDEVTSALDVSVQATILNLLRELQAELGLSMLFISHDLAVVRYISDTVGVMYLGQIVETAPTPSLFDSPDHPYTRALLQSVPRLLHKANAVRSVGDPPDLRDPPSGCRYHTRCAIGPLANSERTICMIDPPPLEGSATHLVACHFAGSRAAVEQVGVD